MRIPYPPRPESKIRPGQLPRLEASGEWVAQYKFNGDRNLVYATTGSLPQIYSRYGRGHGSYKAPTFLRRELGALKLPPGEHWLDSELLASQHTIVLFDVLQLGKWLYGVKQMDRLDMLATICGKPQQKSEPAIALRVSEHVWMAETFDRDFVTHFEEFIHLDLIEGLFLRRRESWLDTYGAKPYDCPWQLRCRKEGPTYSY